MSKRYRNEHDFEEISTGFAPIIFQRITNGFRIENCQSKHFSSVLELINEYHFGNDALLKSTNLRSDGASVRSLCDYVYYILQMKSSIVLLDESNEEVVGVLLLSVINKIDFGRVFSRIAHNAGEVHRKCYDLDLSLNKKIDVYDEFKCETFLRTFLICIKNEHRGKMMATYLFRAAFDISKLLKIPVICGVFNNNKLQRIAMRLGFKVMHEIRYDDWLDDKGEVVFWNTGFGNESCALMIWELPREVEEIVVEEEPVGKKGKKSKGKDKNKKKK